MELHVRVQPKARRNSIEVVEGSKLKVYVTAAPEGGKANDAVIALLAKSLGISKSHIRILRGDKSRDKLLDIARLTEDEVIARLTDR
ncbi:MAG: DUF167 domain-containing protein [Chloroflexi bacterium]|nr:DUF167 domain-containing protein [Chloroflexota bacterium]